jgi:hypothetical protein
LRRQRVCKSVKAKEIEEVEEIEEEEESGANRAEARCSHPSIASNRRIVKKNLLLVRYSFERLAKSFKRGELQRGWGEKVTIQRPGAKPMFGLGPGGRDFQDSTERSKPSLRNRDMRKPQISPLRLARQSGMWITSGLPVIRAQSGENLHSPVPRR